MYFQNNQLYVVQNNRWHTTINDLGQTVKLYKGLPGTIRVITKVRRRRNKYFIRGLKESFNTLEECISLLRDTFGDFIVLNEVTAE
jgi:hypothetical protein